MATSHGPLTSWKRVDALLKEVLTEVHPLDSTECAFFFLEVSKMVDFVVSKCKSNA